MSSLESQTRLVWGIFEGRMAANGYAENLTWCEALYDRHRVSEHALFNIARAASPPITPPAAFVAGVTFGLWLADWQEGR